jgi:colanic acid/amylovoran biosynthesis glycosyltransferase
MNVVAHLKPEYLPLSETFVYEYIGALSRFHPVVLAEDLKNLDQFPVNDLISVRTRDLTLSERAACKLARTLLGITSLQAYKYYEATKRLRPSLVHAHFGPTGVMALPIRRRLGIPLVTTFYGYDVSAYAMIESWQEAYRELFSHGDAFLVEGAFMRQRLVNLGCPESKVRIQPIAVDLDLFPFRPREFNGEKVILLQVGRLVEKKGYEYSLAAFAEAHRRFPRSEVHIIGDGPLRPRLIKLINELGLVDSVKLLGSMTRREYIEHAERCHILIQPSVVAENGDDEGGAPTVLIEMQASGMPIIASRHADIPNVVRENKSAVLVPERDASALTEAIVELMTTPERWAAMAEAGRRLVSEYHNIRVEAQKLEEVYALLCR